MLAQLNPTQTQRRLNDEHKARLAKLWPVQPPRMATVIEFAKPVIAEPVVPPIIEVAPAINAKSNSWHPVRKLQYIVAAHYGLTRGQLLRRTHKYGISHPRQAAMYLAKECTTSSFPEIGRRFGGFDHSTIVHSYNKVCVRSRRNADFAHDLAELELKVREALQ